MIRFPQDTPIKRASINELTSQQLVELVEQMQERRMRSYTAYQEAQEAKSRIKEEKDRDRYQKVLDMLAKKLDVAEKALDAASKYTNELKVLSLVLESSMPEKSAVILPEGSVGTRMLKGRDVRSELFGKLDPAAVEMIAKMAEISHTNTLAVAELATIQSQMMDTLQSFADVAHNMKDRTDQFMRASEQMKQAAEGNPDA